MGHLFRAFTLSKKDQVAQEVNVKGVLCPWITIQVVCFHSDIGDSLVARGS